MNTRIIDKIQSQYDAEHDLGPNAPIHWSVKELSDLVARLVMEVEYQAEQIRELQGLALSSQVDKE